MTSVVSSANPAQAGQAVTFTATVDAVGTPTGTVTFEDGTTVLGTETLAVVNGVDQATFTTSALAAGSHNITAIYGGDANFSGSSGSLTQMVSAESSSSTALTSSSNPATPGQTVTFTATVTGSGGTPTGTVTFEDGPNVLGTASLNASGIATFTTSGLSLGSQTVTAIYGGDSTFGSSSASLAQWVGLFATSTSLTSTVNPAQPGQAVTFTATVAPQGGTGSPTGTVTFLDGTTPLGTGPLSQVGSQMQATFTTSALTSGLHTITAIYTGDTSFSGSSATYTQGVGQPSGSSSSTFLSSSAPTSQPGQSVTFTAIVTGSPGSPTGTVTFMDGTTVLGTVTLSVVNGQAQATFTTAELGVGSHDISAVYSGDATFFGSTAFLFQTVSTTGTSMFLTSSAGSSQPGQSVTFTATVTGGAGTPTGTVTFMDGTTVLGTGTLSVVNGQVQATFTTAALAVGRHQITAIYSGDPAFGGSFASFEQIVV